MPISDERRKQIFEALVMGKFARDGISLGSSARRELGTIAKELAVEEDELRELLVTYVLPRLLAKAYGLGFVEIRAHLTTGIDPHKPKGQQNVGRVIEGRFEKE